MTDETIKSALLSLTAKTTTGQLREMLPLIETKLAAGVKHEEILEVLNAHGLNLTLGSYKTMLYRIRQRSKPDTIPPAPVQGSKFEKVDKVVSQQKSQVPVERVEAVAGKTRTETVLGSEPQEFSFKQMQKKDQK